MIKVIEDMVVLNNSGLIKNKNKKMENPWIILKLRAKKVSN